MFQLTDSVAVVTGGGGFLGGAIAKAFAGAGAKVAVTGRSTKRASAVAQQINDDGGTAKAYAMDVFDIEAIRACHASIEEDFGRVNILVNAAGGNVPEATVLPPDKPFFDVPTDAFQDVFTLNLFGGTVLPCQIFGRGMTENPAGGSIINISSLAAMLPLTRVVAYSASKAAVDNFTRWLAVHLAQEYSPKIRVNAIAPGFFLTDQNRFLLTDEATGELSARGETIISQTPMGRFGDPEELAGAALWLASDASRFATGIVVPVDGGFSAFSGV
jgi:NAD(P)-dependent dehydrogenase (short-subunit alcohol dehydrogenase family)